MGCSSDGFRVWDWIMGLGSGVSRCGWRKLGFAAGGGSVRVWWVRRNSSAGSKWYGCGRTFEDLKFIDLSSGVGLTVD